MSSPHSAFCTTRALLSDLKTLGYKHPLHDQSSPDNAPIKTTSAFDALDENILRYLIAVIDPYAMVGELNMDKFFLASGLTKCASKATPKAKASFLRAVIDLAASSRARREVAAELDFDIDAYGVFTPEDISADNELDLLIKHREELFPKRTKKRARTPLAKKETNIRNTGTNTNIRRSRKPPLPMAAKKSTYENNDTDTDDNNSIKEPVSFSKLSTIDLIREAKKRAANAVKLAAEQDIPLPPPPQLSQRQLSDLGFIPAIVDSADFFDDDTPMNDIINNNNNATAAITPVSAAGVDQAAVRGTAATATDDDDGETDTIINNSKCTDDVKDNSTLPSSVTHNTNIITSCTTSEAKGVKPGIETRGKRDGKTLESPAELDKEPASDDGSITEAPVAPSKVVVLPQPLKKVPSDVTLVGSTSSTSTSCGGISTAEAAAAAALRTEIDLLTTEAEEALAAVKAFEKSAQPLLHGTSSRNNNSNYNQVYDEILSTSVLEAHQAQRKLLQELRTHIEIDRSYNKLENWASKSSHHNTAALEHCRRRAENAQRFSHTLERVD